MRINDPGDSNPDREPGRRRSPLGGGCTQQIAAQMEQLNGHHLKLGDVMGDLRALLVKMAPEIIGVQTVVLDANGAAAVNYRVPFSSLCVDSFSGRELTIANMALQSSAPASGPGVSLVRPGGLSVVNLRGYSWSLYGGSPGELVTVTAFANPQPPAAQSASTTGPQTATVTSVTAAAADTPIFPAAAAVNGRTLYNDSTAALYLKFGTASSTTSYTVQIPSQTYFEFPSPVYAGPVNGTWAAANGAARITSW